MSELENNYKRAFIKYVKLLPELIEEMKRLSRAINNMPRSVRMRP